MTQYLMSVLAEGTELASPDEMATIDAFNDRMRAEGHWVFAAGLAAPGSATVVDGPYVETKEHIAGFWIIEAPHLDVALRLAAGGSKACNRRVELRPILEAPAGA